MYKRQLETVAVRMDSMDFKWVVMALRIQREVGGNLAEVPVSYTHLTLPTIYSV